MPDSFSSDDILEAIGQQPNPQGIASTNTEEDPDVAAKSVDLSKQTGVPAPVIHADPERFNSQLKAQTAGQIVSGNPQLQRYVTSDPMAAKVSSDDWANLDAASQAISKLTPGEQSDFDRFLRARTQQTTPKENPIEGAIRGFTEAVGPGGPPLSPETEEFFKSTGLFPMLQPEVTAAASTLDASGRLFAGVVGGLAGAIGAGAQSSQLERDINAAGQVWPAFEGLKTPEIAETYDKVKPFIDSGKDIPVGVHPAIDEFKKAQADADAGDLKEAIKAAQASATRERSPDMFKQFAEQHTGDQTIGIPADIVTQMYGTKVPAVDDGLLGFVPDLHSQLLRAAVTGEDVKVPLADFLTHVDPKVANDLIPNIRVREGGVTQEEAKAAPVKEPKAAEADNFYQDIGESAVDIGGKIYTGGSHPQAYDKAAGELGESGEDLQQGGQHSEGFINNRTGAFIPREEANELQDQYYTQLANKVQSTPELQDLEAQRTKLVQQVLDPKLKDRALPQLAQVNEKLREATARVRAEHISEIESKRLKAADLTAPVVKVAGQEFDGVSHADAMDKARAAGVPEEALEEAEFGYKTKGGEFVSSDQALKLGVESSEQLPNPAAAEDPMAIAKLYSKNTEETRIDRANSQGFTREGIHATFSDFDKFDLSKEGQETGGEGLLGRGIYVSPKEGQSAEGYGFGKVEGQRQIPLRYRMSNPFVIRLQKDGTYKADWDVLKTHGWGEEEPPGDRVGLSNKFTEAVKAAGFDGVDYAEEDGGYPEHVIFDPKNLRSTFDQYRPENANSEGILFPNDPTTKVIETVRQAAAIEPKELDEEALRPKQAPASFIDALGNRRSAWIQVPEGEMYLRKTPDQLQVANLQFDEDKRGTGAFTKYLNQMEQEAEEHGLNSVMVENIENSRLVPFLSKKGYIEQGNNPLPTMVKQLAPGPATDAVKTGANINGILNSRAIDVGVRKTMADHFADATRKEAELDAKIHNTGTKISHETSEERQKIGSGAFSNPLVPLMQLRRNMTKRSLAENSEPDLVIQQDAPKVAESQAEKDVETQPSAPNETTLPPKVTNDRLFDKASAIGMTEEQYRRYQGKIAIQQAEDQSAALRRAEAFEKKQQTAEWKANEKEVRGQVTDEFTQQPKFMADQAIRNGDIGKLDADSMTEEQKAGLPKNYFKRGGESPDYVARILGYSSGDEMISDLAQLNQERAGVPPGDYLKSLIDTETSKRMVEKFGKLEENIVESAKEQVISETQLDLLHAETEALAGGKLPFTKEDLRRQAEESIGQQQLSRINSDSMLAAAGRAGRAAEDALLKGDPSEAFRQRQRQYASVMYAKESMKVEKAKKGFDKTAKQFSKREVSGALQEYTDQIHGLMVKLGLGVRRSVQDIQESIRKDGYSSFDSFVSAKEESFRDLYVPDFLRDANFNKQLDKLTGEEFLQVAKAFKAMTFNARDELKIIRAGEKVELAATRDEMTQKIESLGPPKVYRIDRSPNKIVEALKSFGWSGIQMETMFNRFDRDDPLGVFNQTLVRTYTEAANYKDRLVKEYQDRLNQIGRIKDIDKLVRNDLFVDPITRMPFSMTKRNVLGILQNIGNDSNLRKLSVGYKLDPETVKQWVLANTTKEDWDRAQQIGEHFNNLFDMADTMSHNISGVGIDRIPISPIDTPHGQYKGWYNPISYDPIRPGQSQKLLGPKALEEDGYYRATTPQGYTKGRTGYVAPVELNLDIIPTRMRQMIHDITMRPAIIQLSKFFYDPAFKRAVINHYGVHQAEAMIPFLRDIANAPNFRSKAEGIFNGFLNGLSQNMVSTMIGMNPSTVMKHGPTAFVNSLSTVGIVPWAREFASMMKSDPATGNSAWKMAMEKSDELNRRMRNWQEVISNTGQDLTLHTSSPKSLWNDVRSVAQYAGSFPVSASDLLSAVPTWLAEYKKQIAEGSDEGQAKFLADRAVRQAHGSSIITNKPEIARSNNAAAGTFTRLYGFFSHILQKQYEIAWRMKDAYGLAREGSVAEATKSVPKIAGMIVSYVIAPAVIEEMVSPYTNSDHDSWGKKAAKTLALGMSSSLIGLRDLAYALVNNRDPEGGVLSGIGKSFTDPIKDLAEGKAFTPAKAGDFLKHFTTMAGIATGITNAQEGKSAQFIYNYFHNREHPQGPWQWATGLRYGKTKGHSRSFNEWLKQEVK